MDARQVVMLGACVAAQERARKLAHSTEDQDWCALKGALL